MLHVRERLVTRAWKGHLIGTGAVVTDSGEALRVLHPGRENRDRGPDFVGAIVKTSGGQVTRGDVELHSRASDWRRHGHDRDPHYDGVILQVVWQGDGEAVARNGRKIPTLSLADVFRCSPEALNRRIELQDPPVESCCDARWRLGEAEIGRLLDDAGDQRFTIKARSFAARMRFELSSQVLYEGMMRALGYTKNAEAFEDLARCLRLSLLEDACRGWPVPERIEMLEALLLGKAGLLPRDAGAGMWRIWDEIGDGEPLPASRWRLFRVRPENHPVQRIAGAAHLVARFLDVGLLTGVVERVSEANSSAESLEERFVVGPRGSDSEGGRCLIGRGRAREMVINIILPFIFAWAEARSQGVLAGQARALYRSCPKGGEYGVTRDLGRLLAGERAVQVVNSARRQQGLVHIDGTCCRPRDCATCPFGRGNSAVVDALDDHSVPVHWRNSVI